MKIYKYFLLHNKKLKPWLKYWLIKNFSFISKLSTILIGENFSLNDTIEKKFNIFNIYGNRKQDGTPTPTNPVEIESSGDNGYITEVISNNDNTKQQILEIPCQQPMMYIKSNSVYFEDKRDEFVKENGVWYEKHNIGKIIINKNDLAINNSYSNLKYLAIPKPTDDIQYDNYSYGTVYFPLFTHGLDLGAMPQAGWNSYIQDGYVYNSATKLYYWMSFEKTKTNEEIIELIGETEMYYVLNEPNYIECTQEQITELEKIKDLKTYNNKTNINSSDNVPSILEIQYWFKEW